MDQSVLRQIPKMDKLLARPAIVQAGGGLPHALLRAAVREALDELRERLSAGEKMPAPEELDREIIERLRSAGRYRLRRVVNATGIVLHTNLGRAPLGEEIARHVAEVARGYSNLEYDLVRGERDSRLAHIEALLCRLTGAEAAFVVNNNAAAVFLMLNTLAAGKRVLISRGELIEIGGSFRIPDILSQSGAELVEVGTTNKTRIADYEKALREEGGALLLKVHSSNFRIMGFSESASLEELKRLAGEYGVPLLFDLGSGFLLRPRGFEAEAEIEVRRAAAVADVVCFSGDKLLGAAQAGILLGKKACIEAMKRNQLSRILRVDKLTLAALEAVLRLYTDETAGREQVPSLRLLGMEPEELETRAAALAERLRAAAPDYTFEAVPCMDEPGGGSMAEVRLPGWAVAVSGGALSPNRLEEALRTAETPVIGRIYQGRLLLSVRTLLEGDEEAIVSAFSDGERNL